MALHSGIDTVAIASLGFYSETYGVGEEANVANLYVSFGYLEDAPEEAAPTGAARHMIVIPVMPTMPVRRV